MRWLWAAVAVAVGCGPDVPPDPPAIKGFECVPGCYCFAVPKSRIPELAEKYPEIYDLSLELAAFAGECVPPEAP